MRKITHLWGWQRQELGEFLREFVQRGCPVIPVLLADASQKPALRVFLRAMAWLDFRRKNPDPMRQLLWGITGKQEAAKVIQAGLICPKCGFQNRDAVDDTKQAHPLCSLVRWERISDLFHLAWLNYYMKYILEGGQNPPSFEG